MIHPTIKYLEELDAAVQELLDISDELEMEGYEMYSIYTYICMAEQRKAEEMNWA